MAAARLDSDPAPAAAAVCTSSTTPLPQSSIDPINPDSTAREHVKGKGDYGKLLDTYGNEFEPPEYTIKEFRDAIPSECFKRSTSRGLGYVGRDLTLLVCTFYLFNTYATPQYVPSYALRFALWTLYGFLNGLFGTGIWVLAHECGHQAFSPSKVVNDTVGFILHSALLVPYFSWKISHGKHHKATAHMERDMVFVPRDRSEFAAKVRSTLEDLYEVSEDAPLHTLLYVVGRQFVGWPVYLVTNNTGHDCHERQGEGRGRGKRNGLLTGVNHFNPSSPIFDAHDAKLILLSDLGLAVTAYVLYLVGSRFGAQNLLVWYFLPYLWVNNWLVGITYLQHTDPALPHYYSAAWTYTRGAAATIDRDFGFIGRHLFHGIMETHVIHHYVSTIPFYNAELATEAIKPVMGKHYKSTKVQGLLGFFQDLYRNVRTCQWVEHSAGAEGEGKAVLFFRNKNGFGPRPLNLKVD